MTDTPAATELPKTFDPAAIEARWYAHWEANGLFRPDRPDAQPFTIVNPPPNVTGSLHIGHALDNTLQDILIRYERLRGRDALWVIGTDHAGIATQMVVERQLDLEQIKRADLGREKFIERVWEWKKESGGQITQQLRRLGASCDWANERFTMDEGFSKAVTHVFVELHKRGLLYRDKRLVNWDPHFQTAISDLEVETREVQGKFWTLRYPLADGSGYVEVATTRPETMLADMAVAVHPDDARYANLVGKMVRLPITGRLIPIIADEHADPELGSGAVKITPGHDFNDYEVGKRAGMKPGEMLNMLDGQSRLVQSGGIPDELLGLDRFDARKCVVELLDAAGALVKVEDRTIATPFGDRSGVVIEPWLTDQWYVDAKTLVGPVLDATRSGAIKIVPESWSKTWFNWLENIQPWCVSRQLWWGHRIPALHGPAKREDGRQTYPTEAGRTRTTTEVFVAETEAEQIALVEAFYGKSARVVDGPDQAVTGAMLQAAKLHTSEEVIVWRDQDVLDTWFSSALWPFATLGWPEPTKDLARHYPNDVLISGFDILFFWDARMAMQGIEFMDSPPWKTLYLHGLVRAADGQKMSKSKGNTVDPLGLIDKYGADALRFFMAAMESQGRDIKMDEARLAGYRNFATKLWNAARFCQSNGIGASQQIAAPAATLAVNKWIIGEIVETQAKLDEALAALRFDEAANTIYAFAWDRFCDWYLELIKPVSSGDERGVIDEESRTVAGWVLDQILVMLHPFMPFITEELWHALGDRPYDLIVAKWPAPEAAVDAEAMAEIDWLIRAVTAIRAARSELSVPPGAKLAAHLSDAGPLTLARIEAQRATLSRLARLAAISRDPMSEAGAAQVVIDEATIILPLEGVIDLAAERARLTKSRDAATKERDALAARLANQNFTARAAPAAVEKARADHADKAAEADRLTAALARLG